eukprot:Hpha_TRINITY_DN10838_c0_g1::TRINITY_DN10838_c0_g1_i1::g.23456::m.23456/K14816/REI1; pre-60S factor REI1
MSAFSCNTCDTHCRDLAALKAHYEDEVHQENVKRRVAGVAPLSQAQYRRRQRGEVSTTASQAQYVCKVCDKKFGSVQTLRSHLDSARHKAKKAQRDAASAGADASPVSPSPASPEEQTSPQHADPLAEAEAAAAEEEKEVEEEEAEEMEPELEPYLPTPIGRVESEDDDLQLGDCLFSSQRFASLEDSLCYMAIEHGFVLPLCDRVSDLEGLMAYLTRKLNGCMCLVCGDRKFFDTRTAAQQHMKAVGHGMIVLHEGEYTDFYDTTPSLAPPAGERLEQMKDKDGRITLPSGRTLVAPSALPHQQERQLVVRTPVPQNLQQQAKRAHVSVQHLQKYKELRAMLEKGYLGKTLKQEQKRLVKDQMKYRMKVGVASNKLHKKGYQGDYVGRTM